MRRRNKNKRQVRIVITSVICLLLVMTVGYAAFSTNLTLNAKGNIKNISAATYLKKNIVTQGDGLYTDKYETGRFIYKGTNPDNYIKFNDELWRIISVETDNTIKIIRNSSIGQMPYDRYGTRVNETSSTTGTYCTSTLACNAWDISDNFVTAFKSGTVKKAATLNEYLNGIYYNGLSSTAKNQIIEHGFSNGTIISGGTETDGYTFGNVVKDEKTTIANSKIAIINLSDYLRATTDTNCNSMWDAWHIIACQNNNYLYHSGEKVVTLSPGYSPDGMWEISDTGYLCSSGDGCGYAHIEDTSVFPTLYLKSDISLSGQGTNGIPYIIN